MTNRWIKHNLDAIHSITRAEGPAAARPGRQVRVPDNAPNPLSPEGATESGRPNPKRGSAVLIALLVLIAVSAIGITVVVSAALGRKVVQDDFYREKAYTIAESGVEKAILEIHRDPQFTGERDVSFDIGTFTTTVRLLDEQHREITAIGEAPKGTTLRYRQSITARVRFAPEGIHVIAWSVSTLPTQHLD